MTAHGHAVLMFDYDGVIADSLDYFMGAFIEACARHGCPAVSNRDDFLALFDRNMYEGMAAVGIGRERHDPVLTTMAEILRRRGRSYRLFEGMPEALEHLARVHELHVVTSNVGRVVREHLCSNGVRCIRSVLGSEAGRSKTEKIRHLTRRAAGAPCYYIGDTLGDIREAHEAGVAAVAVTWGWHDRKRLAAGAPEYVVDTPGQLVALLTPAPQ